MPTKLTLAEKIEILYLAYFLYHQKPYRPALPPKATAIILAVIIFALMIWISPMLNLLWYLIVAVGMLIVWCIVVLMLIVPHANPTILLMAQRLRERYRCWKSEQLQQNASVEIKRWIMILIEEARQGQFKF